MDGLLKVTTEKLLSSSEEFGSMSSEMSALTNEMMDNVQSLSSIWQGEAAAGYRNRFGELKTDMDKLYRMVKEHSEDLWQMAEAYRTAEESNAETPNSLRTNIVV